MDTVLETLQNKSPGIFIFGDYMHISKSVLSWFTVVKHEQRLEVSSGLLGRWEAGLCFDSSPSWLKYKALNGGSCQG